MRITELEVEFEDIMWFAIDNVGQIAVFMSGIYGNVPEFVCKSRENTNRLIDFISLFLYILSFLSYLSRILPSIDIVTICYEINFPLFCDDYILKFKTFSEDYRKFIEILISAENITVKK